MSITDKAWRIVASCQTPEHAKVARKYISLAMQADPLFDPSGMLQELELRFKPVDECVRTRIHNAALNSLAPLMNAQNMRALYARNSAGALGGNPFAGLY